MNRTEPLMPRLKDLHGWQRFPPAQLPDDRDIRRLPEQIDAQVLSRDLGLAFQPAHAALKFTVFDLTDDFGVIFDNHHALAGGPKPIQTGVEERGLRRSNGA